MKRAIRNNVYLFVFYLVAWMVIDFMDVKWQRFPSFKYELEMVLMLVFIGFSWVNRNLFQQFHRASRVLVISLISSIMTVLWFVISVFAVIQFHLAIGGHL